MRIVSEVKSTTQVLTHFSPTPQISKSSLCVGLVQSYKWFTQLVLYILSSWDLGWVECRTGDHVEAGPHGCRSSGWRRPPQLWRRRRPDGGLESRDSPLLGFHGLAWQGGESRGLFYFFEVPYWRRHPSPSIWTHKLYGAILHFGLHDPISCLELKFMCVSKKFGPGCVDGEVTIWVMEESGFKVLYNQWKHSKDTLFFINAITVVYGGWRLLATTSKFIHGTLISHKVSHIKLQHFKLMLPNAMFQLFWSCVFVYLFVT